MQELQAAAMTLGWPVVIALAWALGEFGHRWTRLPRISLYGLVGFLFGPGQMAWVPASSTGAMILLANVAFGLILFEFGYRINWRWLRTNPWIAASGLLESVATFAAVTALSLLWGLPTLTSLLLGSLSMSTSPAAVMRVVNEQRSSGQVTERALHLTALNCMLGVFTFKVVVGFWTYQSSGYESLSLREDILATLRHVEPQAERLGSRAALEHLYRATYEGSDASYLREQQAERGGPEGMVAASLARFRLG
jgi:Kef-type K+ transport system membrane component KefB